MRLSINASALFLLIFTGCFHRNPSDFLLTPKLGSETTFGSPGESYYWVRTTSIEGWTGRMSPTCVVFRGSLMLMGGRNEMESGIYKNDIWSTIDGTHWNCQTPAAPWRGRYQHRTIVFQNRLWLLGGYTAYTLVPETNDIWFTDDGTNWIRSASASPWRGRCDFELLEFDGKLWIFGGKNSFDSQKTMDAWNSPDGVNWQVVATNLPGHIYAVFSSAVFRNTIYLAGVTPHSEIEIWKTTDGTHWLSADDSFDKSFGLFEFATYQGFLWVIGGPNSPNTYTSRLRAARTSDGVGWEEIGGVNWIPRTGFCLTPFNNRLWVVGGELKLTNVQSQPILTSEVWCGPLTVGENQ